MSLSYLSEHADAARIALALAEREAAHLHYTHRTLYAEPIDIAWVEALAEREDLAEKIDAFVGRFGRLQDHIGEKLLPAVARLLGGQPKITARCGRVFRTDGMDRKRRRVYRRAKASQPACARIHDRAYLARPPYCAGVSSEHLLLDRLVAQLVYQSLLSESSFDSKA